MFWLFILLVSNFGISIWNAYVAGRVWGEAEGLMKLICGCAIIVSACGFLESYALICGFASASLHWVSDLSVTYSMVILPALGTGLLIIIHAWIMAHERKDSRPAASIADRDVTTDRVISVTDKIADFFNPGVEDSAPLAVDKWALLLILVIALMIAGSLTYVFYRIGQSAALTSSVKRAEPWALSS